MQGATHLHVTQQLQDATNKLQLQSETCASLEAELATSKASQAEAERGVQSWRQRAVHVEQELKVERRQIELLNNALPQQISSMQVTEVFLQTA